MGMFDNIDFDKVEAAEPQANDLVFDVPADGYVTRIVTAEIKKTQNGDDYLELRLDVAEGEYAGYAEKAEEATGNDWSYKKLRVFSHTEKTQKSCKRFFECLEQSNRGFNFKKWLGKHNIDELCGLIIGIVYDEKVNEYNGKVTKRIEPSIFKVYPADNIRKNDYVAAHLLNEKEKAKLTDNAADVAEAEPFSDVNVPF